MIHQELIQQVQFRSVTLLLFLEPSSSSHFETEAKAFGLQYSAGGNVLTINPIVMDLPLIINVSLLLQSGLVSKKGGVSLSLSFNLVSMLRRKPHQQRDALNHTTTRA